MKKFTKLMLAVAAVTTVSTAMAVSAMAADITGSYDQVSGKVTLENVAPSGDQQTLLVLTEDVDVTDENAGTIIAQIDQAASIVEFQLPKGLTEGTYYVRIGGTNGTIQKGILKIGGVDVETVEITFGNIDRDEYDMIDADDVTALAKWTVDKFGADNEIVGKVYKVVSGVEADTIDFGNIDRDEYDMVDADDVTALAQWTVDKFNDSNSLVETVITVEATPAE